MIITKMILKNKKGADKILSVYWFAILILVAGGIFAMVFNFYNSPYDVRALEANIMINQISDCLSSGGILNKNVVSESNFNEDFKNNFMNECNLNFNTEKGTDDGGQYYVEINFYDFNTENSLFNISEGAAELKADCEVKEVKESKRLSECVQRSFYSVDENNNQYLIQILSSIRKIEKNVN